MTLALKYRPTRFEDLIGQHRVSQTLSLALDQKKISNAYLFSGLRGSGKTSSARIFARALQCDEGPTSHPCGICDNCRASLEGRHIDIIELDAASNRKIDDIRDLIEQTKYKPGFGRYKIFIIDEVHMLTKEAFNALLKTLEEPPEFVKFILATTDPLLLPATILSRTQHFAFRKIPQKNVVDHLVWILEQENIPYEIDALHIIARSGSGSLRDTLTLLEQAIIFGNNTVNLTSVTDMLGIIDPQILDQFFNAILNQNSNLAQELLNLMQEYECEMVLDEMMLSLKEKALAQKLNPILLNRFFNILAQSKTLLSLNTDGEFVLILTLLKMQEATKLKDIHTLIAQLENTSTHQPQNSIHSPLPSPTPQKPLFQILIDKLYDRNQELGECFEKNITFVDFKDQILTLESKAKNEQDKLLLREKYPLIKSFIFEVFQDNVQIRFQHATHSSPQVQSSPQAQQENPTPKNITNQMESAPPTPQETNPNPTPQPPTQDPIAPQILSTPPTPQESSQLASPAPQTSHATPQPQPQPQNFATKHQVLLGNLKKHLQVDLQKGRRI